jgi:hypothetical protein
MGTSLFNTTPAATYPALLKVGDNSTIDTTLKTLSDGSGNDSTLQLSTRRLGILQDTGVTTQVSSVIQATTTNANLVIAPNGTGALIASIPDGTATGGNARGSNAVDLQTSRAINTQVASGSASVIVGGAQNSNSSIGGFIGAGVINSISGADNYQAIVGGQQNTISNSGHSFIGAGLFNNISNASSVGASAILGGQSNSIGAGGRYGSIGGGQSNTVSTNTHATVVGGQSNTASSAHATVIGGSSNTASGNLSVAGGTGVIASGSNSFAYGSATTRATASGAIALGSGMNCTAEGAKGLSVNSTVSGSFAAAIGGFDHLVAASQSVAIGSGHSITAGANCSVVVGLNGAGYLYNQFVQGGATGSSRTNQNSTVNAWRYDTLNSAATTVLSLDGTGVTNLIVPNGTDRMWNVQVRWVAVVSAITGTATGVTVGDTKTSTDLLAVARRSGTTTVSAHTSAGTHAIETTAGSLTAANIVYSAGASQQMAITFTGPTFVGGGSVTMRVVAAISLTEVAY